MREFQVTIEPIEARKQSKLNCNYDAEPGDKFQQAKLDFFAEQIERLVISANLYR